MRKLLTALLLLMSSSIVHAVDREDFNLFGRKQPSVPKVQVVPPDPMAGLLWSYRPGFGWGFHPIGTPGLVPGGGPGQPAPPNPIVPSPTIPVPTLPSFNVFVPIQTCPGGVCPIR